MVLRPGKEGARFLSSTGLLPSLVSLSRTVPLENELFPPRCGLAFTKPTTLGKQHPQA